MARGVVLLVPALAGLPVSEYPANLVKKSVVGAGHADKGQVQMMVRRLLPGCRLRSADAADALAVAICHAHHAAHRAPHRRGAAGGLHDRQAHRPRRSMRAPTPPSSTSTASAIWCSARRARCTGCRRAGGAASLLIETHVREDHIHLYGFVDAAERDWFRLLTTVQGVGARLALAILGVLSPGELAQAIAAQDKASLTPRQRRRPEAGGRIVTELKDKAGGIALGPAWRPLRRSAEPIGPMADAVSALVNLGYRRAEAFGAVAQAARRLGGTPPLDALIRAGLKELSA